MTMVLWIKQPPHGESIIIVNTIIQMLFNWRVNYSSLILITLFGLPCILGILASHVALTFISY